MPVFKSIAVHVHGSDGQKLEEWGPQHRKDISSCYVQSKNDMQFSISLTPTGTFASESRPFQLLATLRIDGRALPEKCSIIYLDKSHQYYKSATNGEVRMEGRKMFDENGRMRWYRWVFREVGIEAMLDDLDLNLMTTSDPDEDPLVTALQGLGAAEWAEKAETFKAGLIEVELKRINVSEHAHIHNPTADAYSRDTRQVDKFGKDISHSTDHTAGEAITDDTTYITYWPYHRGEGDYAKFRFLYRSEDVLRKFGFDGFAPKERRPVDRINQSIAKSLTLSPLTKRSMDESTDQDQKKMKKVSADAAFSSGSDADRDSDRDGEVLFSVFDGQLPKSLTRIEAATTETEAKTLREKPTLQWNQQEGTGNAMQLVGQQAARRDSHKENDAGEQTGDEEDEIL